MDERLEGAIDKSGMWVSSNPRWGRVRAVVVQDEFALVLDDLNSDYREVELSIYRRAGDHWQFVFHQDDAGFPAIGDRNTSRGGWFAGETDGLGYVWTFGREEPGAMVHLSFAGENSELRADNNGWWIYVREADSDDRPSRLA